MITGQMIKATIFTILAIVLMAKVTNRYYREARYVIKYGDT
jgi:hypothetical protein